MWTMNQWARFPFGDRMKQIVSSRGYEPYAWSFAKPLFKGGDNQPTEDELVEMAQLAINGEAPPLKPKTTKKPVRSRKKGGK